MSAFLVDSTVPINASKTPSGVVAQWLERARPKVCSVTAFECFARWKHIEHPAYREEREFLKGFFVTARIENRLIYSDIADIAARTLELCAADGPALKPNDALIAATAEHFGLTLGTADGRKNFVPRLRELNAAGKVNFLLRTYDYDDREAVFARWLKELRA